MALNKPSETLFHIGNGEIPMPIKQRRRPENHESCSYVAPDGGWGWIVLAGAVSISILAPPIVGSFGILLYDIRQQMGVSVSSTAWIASLAQALNFGMTPFVVILSSRFSFRKVAFFGGLCITLGMFLTYFAKKLEVLYVTIGILGGLGQGLSMKSSMFMVNLYFDKRRGFATGCFFTGAAISRLIFPIVIQILLIEYGYTGTTMIWSGILSHICIAAALYQPVSQHRIHVPGSTCSDLLPVSETDNDNNVDYFNQNNVNEEEATMMTMTMDKNAINCLIVPKAEPALNGILANKSAELEAFLDVDTGHTNLLRRKQSTATLASIRSAYDLLTVGNVDVLNDDPKGLSHNSDAKSCKKEKETVATSKSNDNNFSTSNKLKLDFALLKEPQFYAVCCSGIFSSVATGNMIVFIPSMGRSKGLSGVNAAWLLSSVGVGEIIGRLVIPWLQDMHFMPAKYSFMIGAAVSAFVAAVLTMPESYSTMIGLCVLLGVSAGSMTGLGSVINVETIGLARLHSSLSFTQFLQGVFVLPAGPILGAIRDATGDYVQCFYLMSGLYCCAFFVWLIETILTKRAQMKKTRLAEANIDSDVESAKRRATNIVK